MTVASTSGSLPAEVVYAEAFGAGCADLEVLDDQLAPAPHICTVLGPSLFGDVLLIEPDPSWVGTALSVGLTGQTGGFELEVAIDPIAAGSGAIPDARTVFEDGVTYDVCRDGVVVAVVQSDSPPADLSNATLLGPFDLSIYLGVANGSWPEATANATGTFWFATLDGTGAQSEWIADEVDLASTGTIRTDLKLSANPEDCPSETLPWIVGDEVDAAGSGVPNGKGSGPPKNAGCGCASPASPVSMWWVLVPLLARRYQSSSK